MNPMKYYIKKDDYFLTSLFPVTFSLIESNDTLDKAYCYNIHLIACNIAKQLQATVFPVNNQ